MRSYPVDRLTCKHHNLNGAVCLALAGELDLASLPSLQQELHTAARREAHLIIEMSELRNIDSSGINALLEAHRTLDVTMRRVVLVAPSAAIRRILGVLSLETIMPVYRSVVAALEVLR